MRVDAATELLAMALYEQDPYLYQPEGQRQEQRFGLPVRWTQLSERDKDFYRTMALRGRPL